MRLKSYFAASVAEAIENARVELGPEAMLLNSREIAPEQRHLGAYEVVFGITGEPLLPRRSEAVAHLFTANQVPAAKVSLDQVTANHVTANHVTANHVTANQVLVSQAPASPAEPLLRTNRSQSKPLGLGVKHFVPPAVTPASVLPPPPEIPAWKRTLEELVARQEAPVPVSSIPAPKASTVPFTPVQPAEPAPGAAASKPTPARFAAAASSGKTPPAPPPSTRTVASQPEVAPRSSAPPTPTRAATPVSSRAAIEAPSAANGTGQPPALAFQFSAAEATPSPEILADELVSLRQQIERVKTSLASNNFQPATANRPRELDLLNAQMVGLGFSQAFAQKMGDAAVERLAAFSAESASLSFLSRSGYSLEHLQQVLIAELQSRFKVKPDLGVPGSGRKTVMLVGPPGAGKTTTLVKLAIKYGMERRLPVHLLSLDTVRIGGSEQLATFARILNAGFDALHTTAALGEALGDCRTDQVVLIDCPGYAPADMEQASATAAFLRNNQDVDVQLVLPAFMNASSLHASSQRFAMFEPSKLIFTHLDEVDSLGTILEHTIKASLPVSFLTNGQGIPQDLQEASKDRFTQGILNGAAAFGAA